MAVSATTSAELNNTSETFSRGYRAWLLFVLLLVNLLNLADGQGLAAVADACAAASASGVLQAIGVFSVFFLWTAVHFLLAAKHLVLDLDQTYA